MVSPSYNFDFHTCLFYNWRNNHYNLSQNRRWRLQIASFVWANSPKPKDVQFTVIQIRENLYILTFKRLESSGLWHFHFDYQNCYRLLIRLIRRLRVKLELIVWISILVCSVDVETTEERLKRLTRIALILLEDLKGPILWSQIGNQWLIGNKNASPVHPSKPVTWDQSRMNDDQK